MENHVDLIEGQPIFDQTLVACEEGTAQAFVKFKHLTIAPATVGLNQVHWTVKVGNGHKGLNAVLVALLKQVFVESQAFFVRL